MNLETLLQYTSYGFMVIGILAAVVSIITQVTKEIAFLNRIPTSLQVLVLSLILCPVALVAACQYLKIVITWYMVFGSFIAAFVVALVAMGGWEKVREIWNRTKYNEGE